MGITDKVKGALSSNNNQKHSDGTAYSAPSGTHVYGNDPNSQYNTNGLNYNSSSPTGQTYNPSTQAYDTHNSSHHSHGLSAPFSHHSNSQTTTSQTWNPVTQSYDQHTTTPATGHHSGTTSTYNPVTQSTTTQSYNPITHSQHQNTSHVGHNATPVASHSQQHNTTHLGHNTTPLASEPVATPAAIEPQHSMLGSNLTPNTYNGPATAPTPQNTMIKPVAQNQYGETTHGTSDRRPIHPDPPVHERNAMDPADTRHGSNVMTSTGASGNPATSHVAETALHNDYNDHHHHDHKNTLGHDHSHSLVHRNKDHHDPYKAKEDTNIREQAREYRHENALNQAETIPAANVPQAIIPTADQAGHKMPDFRGAKIVHKCNHCGVDNDISQYFRQEAVYRLG